MSDEPKPKIVKKSCMSVQLTPGTYYFCTCGHSQTQPFCDGAHQDKGFSPKRFKISEPTQTYLCLCKHSQNMPYCDGSHSKLKD